MTQWREGYYFVSDGGREGYLNVVTSAETKHFLFEMRNDAEKILWTINRILVEKGEDF